MKKSDMIDAVRALHTRQHRLPTTKEIASHLRITPVDAERLLAQLVSMRLLDQQGNGYRVPQVAPKAAEPEQAPEAANVENSSQAATTPTPAHNVIAATRAVRERLISISDAVKRARKTVADAEAEREQAGQTGPGAQEAMSAPVEPAKAADSAPQRITIDGWQVLVIRWAMAVVGVASSVVSAYFAIDRLSNFLPLYGAVIFGVVIVLFSVVAFETVIVYMRRGKRAISGVLIALWLTVWVFTLQAATAGMYSFYGHVQHTSAVSQAASNTASVELSIIRANEADLTAQIDQKRKEITDIQGLLSQFTSLSAQTANQYQYNILQSRLLSREQDLTALTGSLRDERAKELRLVQSTPAALAQSKRVDFYQWIAQLTGWRADTIELVSSLFPALFLDTISVTALAIALFL